MSAPEHGAIVTYGFRRIGLTFPDLESVMTSSRSPSAANHTGVETPEPSRRKLVMLRYLPLMAATSVRAGGTSRRCESGSSVGVRTDFIMPHLPWRALDERCPRR
mgnify:CR=1 FL=1